VASTIPAVVSVAISADVPIIERYYQEFSPFGGFFGRDFGFSVPRERQIGTEEREIGGGSGFFVSSDGFIITNRHVVEFEDANYSIVTNDGDSFDATVVARDSMLDIAVLKVEGTEPFPFLTFSDSSARLGEPVIAIGNALAEFPNTVSTGVVSGLSRNIVATGGRGMLESLEGVIQTDAAINRGNSGGPLLNFSGEVIGVNVAVAGGGENIGFALPADVVADVFTSVAEFGEIVRPFIGVRYLQINEAVADANQLPVEYGVLVIGGESPAEPAVVPDSPADRAGLRENDIILEFDGVRLDGEQSLGSIVREYDVGETIPLTVLRDGEERTVTLTLERAPSQ